MSGVISITTDFGHKGPFVAVMKAVMLGRCPNASIIDFTHEIPVHWPPEAGFWLRRAYAYFPKGTIHVAVVDPGVGTERDILIAEVDGHFFLAPDNGLLAPVLENAPDKKVFRLNLPALTACMDLPEPSATFHGRDIFAPVAAELLAGRVTPEDIGETVGDWTPSQIDDPVVSRNLISGTIITVDTFGNLISNIDADTLGDKSQAVVEIAGRKLSLSTTYGRHAPGEYLALINSFGVVEVARSEGSASETLGLGRGAPVRIRLA